MELTRKQIIQTGLANEAFNAALKSDESLADQVSVKARMIMSLNTKGVADEFTFIKEEEARIQEKNFGLSVGNLGYLYLEDKKQLESKKKALEELLNSLNDLIQEKDLKGFEEKINAEFPVTDKTVKNREKANKEWSEFVENKDEKLECKVSKINANDFDLKSKSLSNVFINNYAAADLISI